jgi:hypothetical protein
VSFPLLRRRHQRSNLVRSAARRTRTDRWCHYAPPSVPSRPFAPALRPVARGGPSPSSPSSSSPPTRAGLRWRPLRPILALVFVSLLGAACSSGSGSSTTTTTSAPTTTSTTSTTGSTSQAGSLPAGTQQTAVGPGGQRVVVSATKANSQGRIVGGPPGSWIVGFVVTNTGTASFAWDPSSQVTVIDTSGGRLAPVAQQNASFRSSPSFGAPTTIAAGRTLRPIIPFSFPAGATPTTAVVAPFGPSGPSLRWTIS